MDQQHYLGNSIRVPGPDATDEDRAKFHEKLLNNAPDLMLKPNAEDEQAMETLFQQMGRPEKASEYEVEIPEGLEFPQERLDLIKDLAYKNGLSRRQLKGVLDELNAHDLQQESAAAEFLQNSQKELANEWGVMYDKHMDATRGMLEKTGAPKQLVDAMEAKALNADTIKWLHSLNKQLGTEGIEISNQDSQGNGMYAPEEAAARADEIFNKMMDLPESDPQYARLMKKRHDLIKMSHAG